jgi:hypothetical protein
MRARVLALLVVAACGSSKTFLPVEQLMDPETCKDCHADHYAQWSGSMHAYASNDPVFLAMNARGQHDTGGVLGGFCVQCHAPIAVKLGLTTDGMNLDSVPQYAKGVTCYFCHNVTEVTGDHNAALTIAMDDVMRGGISNPVDSPAHDTTHSGLLDSLDDKSATMCGACHDVITPVPPAPAPVHLERTFAEWRGTIFGDTTNARTHLTCGQCHMFATDGVVTSGPGATNLDVPLRPLGVHEHTFGGIDLALTPWPDKDGQIAAITRDLGPAVGAKLCVSPTNGGEIQITLDDRGPGHNWPSGAAQDRRAWVQVVAYDASNNVVFQSGVVPAGMDPEDIGDANLWQMNDKVTDVTGAPAHFFWQVESYDGKATLPPAVTTDISDPRYYHAVTHTYPTPGMIGQFARVDMRVSIRPLPLAMLDDLVGSGDLDAAVVSGMQTTDLVGTELEWTAAMGTQSCAM